MSQLQPDPIPAGQKAEPKAGLGFLTRGYKPLAGAYDEMMAPDGSLRGPWPALLQRLADLGEEGVREAFAGAEQQLKNSGVFFRVYDDPVGAERPWPLTPVPLLISPSEWAALSAGAVQRARLAEALLADVYGPGRLARDGGNRAVAPRPVGKIRRQLQHWTGARRRVASARRVILWLRLRPGAAR